MLNEVLQIEVYKAEASGGSWLQMLTLHSQVDLALLFIKTRGSSSMLYEECSSFLHFVMF